MGGGVGGGEVGRVYVVEITLLLALAASTFATRAAKRVEAVVAHILLYGLFLESRLSSLSLPAILNGRRVRVCRGQPGGFF